MTADSPRLATYELADQFGHEHTRDDVGGHMAVYVVAERAGATALEQWTTALHAATAGAQPALGIVPVVRIPGVPRLVRGAVRRLLPSDPDAWTLLDWDDVLSVLVVPNAECTVSVVAPDGRIVRREAVGLPDAESVARLLQVALDATSEPRASARGPRRAP